MSELDLLHSENNSSSEHTNNCSRDHLLPEQLIKDLQSITETNSTSGISYEEGFEEISSTKEPIDQSHYDPNNTNITHIEEPSNNGENIEVDHNEKSNEGTLLKNNIVEEDKSNSTSMNTKEKIVEENNLINNEINNKSEDLEETKISRDINCNSAEYILLQTKERRKKLKIKSNQLMENIQPNEFEGYYDFYLLNTFKRGQSSAGIVDMDALRRREHNIYYKKIGFDDVNDDENIPENEYKDTIIDCRDSNFDADYIEETRHSLKNNSTNNHTNKIQPRRRLTRSQVSNKETPNSSSTSLVSVASKDNKKSEDSPSTTNTTDNDNNGDIENGYVKPLYESLVSKVKKPYRRSDWVLPTKYRYTREKHFHTKPTFEVIKINELINNTKFKTILSRFEGGLAGVYKRNNNTAP
ncbi:hypothetical protein TBLA_0B03440 [Henningerozyma blattae CBS 6284]|uniref:Uncharacterized protein n=1 Tax=Henningerozyma blattae (strain ATCC 34711 / CBS 6284 / DSM 70876 / NBRC 10599 / NRRL Y-10934 / UCD 77-7) TaxID=1071380 RepID=I2GYI3_HENB6|nr:hypothetical protein TBLA_0B03440 [Tetrapisispora blattae CBS 6284]CCH59185.1 hypothetical protein TBLA_0B03440 [Tetrapisispora blattae CBS 6284]